MPCNRALLAQEALFLPKKGLFLPKDLQKKVRKLRQNSVCSGLKFSSESKLFGGCHPCSCATSATLFSINKKYQNFKTMSYNLPFWIYHFLAGQLREETWRRWKSITGKFCQI